MTAVFGPVRERVELIESGALGLADWCATADQWSFAADARYRACVELRPATSAVRLGVKDTVDVAGFATRLGLRRYRHYPARTATPLRGLSNVEINAKVVSTELNIGLGSGCGNPYFPRISPAGSSTGSAVAVAAGICDISLGTDVLGSVRWPAGRCGVVGLRMTHDPGRLDGVFPLSPLMDAPGWVGRTADDLAYLWRYLGLGAAVRRGPARVDPARVGPARVGPARIGVVCEVAEGGVEPEVLAALDRTAKALEAAGHHIVPVRLGELWRYRGAAWELCARDAWDGYRGAWPIRVDEELHDSTLRALQAGARVSDARYAAIRAALREQRAQVTGRFVDERVDAWLLPLDPEVPRPIDAGPAATAGGATSTIPTPEDPEYDREVGYTPIASFAGLPAITFPVGLGTQAGAPLAMQLIGPPRTEPRLIGLAAEVAESIGDLGFRPELLCSSED